MKHAMTIGGTPGIDVRIDPKNTNKDILNE